MSEGEIVRVMRGSVPETDRNALTKEEWYAIARSLIDASLVAFPDTELTEGCHRCGVRYWPIIWHTSDEMWARIAGTFNHDDGGGLLCPRCFSALACDRGLGLVWTPALEPRPASVDTPATKEDANE